MWIALGMAGCSTKKNTANVRRYHAFTARYNTYYNGHEAYKEGMLELERANRDNYMEILPYFPVGNKKTVGSGSGNFDRAIDKSQKAIKQHSIKKKPKRKAGEKKTGENLRSFCFLSNYFSAIASISHSRPLGRVLTATQLRAGLDTKYCS